MFKCVKEVGSFLQTLGSSGTADSKGTRFTADLSTEEQEGQWITIKLPLSAYNVIRWQMPKTIHVKGFYKPTDSI